MASDSQTSFCGPGGDTFSCHTRGHLDKGSAFRLNVSVSWVQQVYPAGGVPYSGATGVFEQSGNMNGAEFKKERKSVWKVGSLGEVAAFALPFPGCIREAQACVLGILTAVGMLG